MYSDNVFINGTTKGCEIMYENIFKRVEKKFLLTEEEYHELFKRIEKNLLHDKYYASTICNIYFDNDNNDLLINSIEKPIYKHKVRLRSYGIPTLNDDVFLEIKSKYKSMVGKRRIKLKLNDFKKYQKTKKYSQNEQIMKEIDYLFKLYDLKPAYFVAYDRKSFIGKDDAQLRITVDTNLRSRKDHLTLEYGDKGQNYFEEKMYIMEIKTLGAIPLWLVQNLSELKIYARSFSKIGNVYIKDKEEDLC